MRKKGNLRWLWLSFAVIALDQWTKYLATQHLAFAQPYSVIKFFNLRLAYNKGAAFSFLSSASGWQNWFFIGFACLVCVLVLIWLSRIPRNQYWLATALSLIFGGALGNLMDRAYYGHVIDFIDLYVKNWHWPTFNLADSAICIGVVMLLLDVVFGKDKKEKN
jgi:signal peptidase II